MGKVKTVIMGDEKAEELARAKAEAKREQKKASKQTEKSTNTVKSDMEKSAEILKMMSEEKPVVSETKAVSEETKDKKKTKVSKQSAVNGQELSEKSKLAAEPSPLAAKSKHGKKYSEMRALVVKNKAYPLAEAIELAKKSSYSKFDGAIEAHINVSEKGLRGTVQLPHGIGKAVRVAVADDALIEEIATGKINFDVLVAHPAMMPKLAKVAKILGPKGLMPNPKTGTISDKTDELVKKLSAGQTNWKTEASFPIVHLVLGKVSFDSKKIEENYLTIAKSIGKNNLKSAFLKATMGPSVKILV